MGVEEASEAKEMLQPVKQDTEDHGPEPHIYENSALARVEAEKRLALVKAWEENEKAKVDNKAHKKISAIGSWENTKKADVEAQLRSFEEKLEKKAEYAEKMKNKVAELYKEAEKRAMIEAEKGEEFLKIEETTTKYRSTGYIPNIFLACFSSRHLQLIFCWRNFFLEFACSLLLLVCKSDILIQVSIFIPVYTCEIH
ncbi:remorin 1.4-like [Hibiscus syriacus]|uniref:remorin 1.4-like n=1 Tax=Hibiscus syriacus TaxID=106335 RepID=UPI0019226C6F|nr:remorin 1.4-like [Hibiscus syriacus]